LAIVWAIGKLQNYLYGTKEIRIFTDHQPLTFAVSERNTNAKIKRWKAFIEEHNAKVFYKLGKENFVADALSRQNINAIQGEPQSDVATIHSELSLTYTVESTDKPLNCYRNQIILEEAKLFTTLDLKSGYHQIYLAEKDREKTAFSIHGGKYEF